MPSTARWSKAIEASIQLLATVRDVMQGYFDDRAETWQESDRADEMQAGIDAIAAAISAVEGAAT